jgi:hypothetical protein
VKYIPVQERLSYECEIWHGNKVSGNKIELKIPILKITNTARNFEVMSDIFM